MLCAPNCYRALLGHAGRELPDAFYFVIQRRNPDITSLELAGPGLKQSSARLRIPCRFQYAIPKASFRVSRLIHLELQATLNESTREAFAPVRQQLTVYSHAQLGTIAIKEGDYREALRWYRMADDEQTRFGGKWTPDLNATRKRLETIVGSSSDR